MATDALFMLSIGIAVAVLLATPPQPTTEEAREMRNGPWQRQRLQAWLLATIPLFCLTISTKAQNPTVQDNRSVPASDSTRKSLADFDHFLDNHPEIAEQVRKDPSLLAIRRQSWGAKRVSARQPRRAGRPDGEPQWLCQGSTTVQQWRDRHQW
jgi:hypothetical protein